MFIVPRNILSKCDDQGCQPVRKFSRLTRYSNPKDYNDNEDATTYDKRLRGPVRPIELDIDPETGMKNYIANEKGDWATSVAYVKHSFERSIHHGRLYTNGQGLFKGKDADLAEALRLMGQGLHTLEDFSAHSNYVELALRNQGFHNVFPHCGTDTQVNIRGKYIFPLVTGTFGMVDFYHSVLGEATDHFTQNEVNEMDNAMQIAQTSAHASNPLFTLIKLLSKVPGTRDLCLEAEELQRKADMQSRELGESGSVGSGWYSGQRGIDDGAYAGTSRAPGDWNPGQPEWGPPQAYPPQSSGYDSMPAWSQYSGGPSQQQPWSQQQYQAYNPSGPQPQWNDQQHPQSFNMQGAPPQPQWQPPQQNPQFGQQAQWQDSYPQHPPSYNPNPPYQPPYQPPPDHRPQSYSQQPGPQQPSWQTQQPPRPPTAGSAQTQPPQTQSVPSNEQQPQELPAGANPQPTPVQPQQQPTSVPGGLPDLPNFDPAKTISQIYPILAFRDKVVRTISAVIEKIPGLEALVDRITETLTVFVLSLLAPFVRPLLKALTKSLQLSSSGVVESSAKHQFEPWSDPNCTNPTHSMLSKDHFSNVLNEPAGLVAAEVVKFIAPRVLYAWQHPDVPVDQVLRDVEKIFHHPAFRNMELEVHRNMFQAVERWQRGYQGAPLGDILSSEGVKNGKNQKAQTHAGHSHAPLPIPGGAQFQQFHHQFQHHHGGAGRGGGMHFNVGGVDVGHLASQVMGGGGHHQGGGGAANVGSYLNLASKLPGMHGLGKINKYANMMQSFGGGRRELDESEVSGVAGEQGFLGGEIGGQREFQDAESGANTAGGEAEGWQAIPPPAG